MKILASYAPDSLEGDPDLAAITRFAAHLCQAPVAAVTVTGPQNERFLTHHGSTLREIPRDIAFCPHVMACGQTMVVPDAREDARFANNPNVLGAPHIRFYAGQPLISGEGVALGTLSVIDSTPRPEGLTELQRDGLIVLADAAMLRLRAHRKELAAEREAEAREEYLHKLADSIPAIAWSATPEGHFDYFNQRMVDFTGLPDDQSGSALHPDDWKTASAKWQHSLKTGEIYEVEHRLCRHDGEYRWMISRALPVRDGDGKILRWFGTAVDIHDIYEASEGRDLLAKELSHRIKNIFAVIAGLVSLSARQHPEALQFADELTATIRALGRAHEFVRPVDGARRGNLQTLLKELFAPYGSGDGARVKVTGDDLAISSRTATPLALVFHELATNAAKYGALATADGRVTLKIADNGKRVKLTWRETGGKAPKKTPQEGFGSRLVEMSVTGQLGGTWERRFEDDGLVVEFSLPKATIGA
ncbi:MAG TPA: PAS domain-containing protein [Croceibacterium sp.]|nr:PAS domain-containing protein [Croceibacterium sp.]